MPASPFVKLERKRMMHVISSKGIKEDVTVSFQGNICKQWREAGFQAHLCQWHFLFADQAALLSAF